METKPNKEEMVRFLEAIYKGALTEEIEVAAPNECIAPQIVKVNVKGLILQILDVLGYSSKENICKKKYDIKLGSLYPSEFLCPTGCVNIGTNMYVKIGEKVTVLKSSKGHAILKTNDGHVCCITLADLGQFFKPIGG